VNGPARSGVSSLLSDAVSLVSGIAAHACEDPALRLEADLGIDSLALAELVEVISARAGTVIPDEETGRVLTVGDLQDILDALAPGTRTTT
jgi:acyl carrier protein